MADGRVQKLAIMNLEFGCDVRTRIPVDCRCDCCCCCHAHRHMNERDQTLVANMHTSKHACIVIPHANTRRFIVLQLRTNRKCVTHHSGRYRIHANLRSRTPGHWPRWPSWRRPPRFGTTSLSRDFCLYEERESNSGESIVERNWMAIARPVSIELTGRFARNGC